MRTVDRGRSASVGGGLGPTDLSASATPAVCKPLGQAFRAEGGAQQFAFLRRGLKSATELGCAISMVVPGHREAVAHQLFIGSGSGCAPRYRRLRLRRCGRAQSSSGRRRLACRRRAAVAAWEHAARTRTCRWGCGCCGVDGIGSPKWCNDLYHSWQRAHRWRRWRAGRRRRSRFRLPRQRLRYALPRHVHVAPAAPMPGRRWCAPLSVRGARARAPAEPGGRRVHEGQRGRFQLRMAIDLGALQRLVRLALGAKARSGPPRAVTMCAVASPPAPAEFLRGHGGTRVQVDAVEQRTPSLPW